MARVIAHVSPNIGDKILRRVQPALYRDMHRRGDNVKGAAKRHLRYGSPARYWTGALSASIEVDMFRHDKAFGARIGTSIYYAKWVHDGTGIFGPRGTPITPVTADYLAFVRKGGSRVERRKSVAGMKPNPFMKNAISAAAP